ncbi:substrate-binding domain-containing protein [Micromonospora sp. CA-263727]|uniref:substrate-binding domain-containing protein n=1 Tax=Micromonospora sp. CA-263727 TaxID=3239967 RepID=UPI003D8C526D
MGAEHAAAAGGVPGVPAGARAAGAYRDRGLSLDTGAAGARRVLRDWPDTDAIVAITDATALGALRALAEAGRRVPEDVAVVGFDDVPLAALGQPPLTTATHPVERIAVSAVRCLLGGTATADQAVLHPSTLVHRQSA